MSEIKVFRVIGEIAKPGFRTSFQKEVRSIKSDDVIEKIFSEIGSKHRAKRFQIKIFKVEEIGLEEIKDPVIRRLTLEENRSDE